METSLENNKRIIREFYELALNKKDTDAAAKYIISKGYKQHSPTVGDGIEGFKEFFANRNKEFPQSRAVVKRVLAEGDYVVCHVHSSRVPGGKQEFAAIDIFRLEEGIICEHWDVVQKIPEKSKNPNGMF